MKQIRFDHWEDFLDILNQMTDWGWIVTNEGDYVELETKCPSLENVRAWILYGDYVDFKITMEGKRGPNGEIHPEASKDSNIIFNTICTVVKNIDLDYWDKMMKGESII